MTRKRQIEIFSAGCPLCADVVEMVRRIACPSCEVSVLDMNEDVVARRATTLGVRTLPAVAVDGALLECCAGGGLEEAALRAAGVGCAL